jgi:DNA-binding CsgD family transcriptional regulator
MRISRRTAERRLGEARALLGVRTTVEAVVLVSAGYTARAVLAPRERQILALIANGQTSRAIASQLGISPSTVDACTRSAMAKINARTRVQAAARIASANQIGAD